MRANPKTASIQVLRNIALYSPEAPEDQRLEFALELITRQKHIALLSKAFRNPEDAAEYAQVAIGFEDVEHFMVLLLDSQQRVIFDQVTAMGGPDYCSIQVLPIVRLAVEKKAVNVIVVHNHPSGNLKPSESDIKLTKTIKEALNLLEMRLLDSIIVTREPGRFTSLAQEGLF